MDMSRVVCYVTPDMKCNKNSLAITNDRKVPSWLESLGSILWSNLITALLFLLEWTVVVVILFQMFRLKKNQTAETLRKPTTPRLRRDTNQLSVIYEEEENTEEQELTTEENAEEGDDSLKDCEESGLSSMESREDYEERDLRTMESLDLH